MKSLRNSECEDAMVDVLHSAESPLTLGEIVELIHKTDSSLLAGTSPTKSLYSMLLRREGFRAKHGLEVLFVVSKERGSLLYSLANIK